MIVPISTQSLLCPPPVFFKSVMKMFGWSHMTIVYDTWDVLMRIQATALKKALLTDPYYPRPYDIEFDTTKNPDYFEILTEASNHARGEENWVQLNT